MTARHILASGQVQGVGFRVTARSIAERLGLSGWVRNLSDGRVELMVQGPDVAVDELLHELGALFHISETACSQVDGGPCSDRFSIVP